MTDRRTPVLPPHVEDTVQAIAHVHLEHQRRATPVQRVVDRMTSFVARPRFVGLLTGAFSIWIAVNLALHLLDREPLDPLPFPWLELFATLLALFISVLILITQSRENELTERREQLTLQLSILAERKSAKIIGLLEELRRDIPGIRDRVDAEADEMAMAADTEAVLKAIHETHENDVEP